jgi:isocitrate dehydrogenase
MFNSIGVIGLLVLAGVLLTTAMAPANAWHGSSVTDYAQAQPVNPQPTVLQPRL